MATSGKSAEGLRIEVTAPEPPPRTSPGALLGDEPALEDGALRDAVGRRLSCLRGWAEEGKASAKFGKLSVRACRKCLPLFMNLTDKFVTCVKFCQVVGICLTKFASKLVDIWQFSDDV